MEAKKDNGSRGNGTISTNYAEQVISIVNDLFIVPDCLSECRLLFSYR